MHFRAKQDDNHVKWEGKSEIYLKLRTQIYRIATRLGVCVVGIRLGFTFFVSLFLFSSLALCTVLLFLLRLMMCREYANRTGEEEAYHTSTREHSWRALERVIEENCHQPASQKASQPVYSTTIPALCECNYYYIAISC